mmetsp:Transcript_23443/g.3856  ORF Transcript_23443/g.3856 Transcript_23443/m.3856 type:complete len:89 (-) Transcript_23443:639-905(-)
MGSCIPLILGTYCSFSTCVEIIALIRLDIEFTWPILLLGAAIKAYGKTFPIPCSSDLSFYIFPSPSDTTISQFSPFSVFLMEKARFSP